MRLRGHAEQSIVKAGRGEPAAREVGGEGTVARAVHARVEVGGNAGRAPLALERDPAVQAALLGEGAGGERLNAALVEAKVEYLGGKAGTHALVGDGIGGGVGVER